MRKHICAALLVGASCSAAVAGTFTENSGAGSSTVGPGGDYTSLFDAAADFNGAQAVTGDYTFYILDDLSESSNVGFGKNTNGFTVTIKPAPGTQPTITFTRTTDNTGPTGNLVIGCSDLTASSPWPLVTTNNFVIDGSNTVGGSTRDLTLTNTAVTFNLSRVVVALGDSNDGTIKNCNIINIATGTGTTPCALAVSMRNQDSTNYIPDDWTIENNLIRCIAANNGMGIEFAKSGTIPTPNAETGMVVKDNEIEARIRGIYMNAGADATIEGNSIKSGQGGTVAGLLIYGIYVVSANSQTNATFNVLSNNIYVSTNNTNAGNFGGLGIAAISAVGTGCTANIINNMIHVRNTAAATGNAMRLCGTDLVSAVTFNVRHNSILISSQNALTNQVPNTGGATITNGVHCLGTHRASLAAVVNSSNNIFHCNVPGGAAVNRMSTAGSYTCNYNDLSNNGGHTGAIGTTVWTSLADWKTNSGTDANSFSVNPLTTTGSSWTASTNADLHFTPTTSKPAELVGVNAAAGVTTDIDGDTRSTNNGEVYPGADEIATAALPVSMSGFSID